PSTRIPIRQAGWPLPAELRAPSLGLSVLLIHTRFPRSTERCVSEFAIPAKRLPPLADSLRCHSPERSLLAGVPRPTGDPDPRSRRLSQRVSSSAATALQNWARRR